MQIDFSTSKLLRIVKDAERDKEFLRYKASWRNEFRGRWRKSSLTSLRAQTLAADLVILGDFHGFEQSQRTHLRILRALPSMPARTIYMECFEPRHDRFVQDWLRGRIDDLQLIDRTQWNRNWGFPWEFYRPLLDLARSKGWRVKGLGKLNQSLRERDEYASARLAREKSENPFQVVIVGDFHVNSSGFLGLVRKSRDHARILVVHQNSEAAFLNNSRLAKSQVYIKNSGEFCLVNSSPTLKWLSHHHHLQIGGGGVEVSDLMIERFEWLRQTWRFSKPPIKSQENWQLSDWENPVKLGRDGWDCARNNVSFINPQAKRVFLSKPSLNLVAHLAAQSCLLDELKDRERWRARPPFTDLLYLEICGYVLSKTFNPYRSARTLLDLAREANSNRTARLAFPVVETFLVSGKLQKSPRPMSIEVFAARRIGAILGELFWRKCRKNERRYPALFKFFLRGQSQSERQRIINNLRLNVRKMKIESRGERI